jgi:hypothetical protein
MAEVFSGGCHCGAIRVRFEISTAPAELPLRRCACSFCRKHGATTATDPTGRLDLQIVRLEDAVRYRFGARSADFLVCGRCGVYVAAVMSSEAGAVATLNVNTLDDRAAFTQPPEAVDYAFETEQQRRLRRAERWTLTTVSIAD